MEKFDKKTAEQLIKTLADIMHANEVLYSLMLDLGTDKRSIRCIHKTVDICKSTIHNLFILKYKNENN